MKNETQTKLCNNLSCNKIKPISQFHKHKTGRYGVSSICGECDSLKRKLLTQTKEGLITTMYSTQRRNCRQREHELPLYTRLELKQWCLSQKKFHRLFKAWKKSDFHTDLRPSVDRKDDYKTYDFKNIQLMTWKKNRDKSYMDRKSGKNIKGMKAILQYSLSNIFLREFYSIKEASKITGVSDSIINKFLSKTNKTGGGFIWKYK